MDFVEFIVYDRELTDTERESVEADLRSRYFPVPVVLILGAEVELFFDNTILISGRDLGDIAPTVTLFVPALGEVGLRVLDFNPLTQEILAELPLGIEDRPGTFRLTVFRESDPSNFDDFDVTIVPSIPGRGRR